MKGMKKPDVNKSVLLPPTPEEKKAFYLGCIALFVLLLFIGMLTYFLTINKTLKMKEKAHTQTEYAIV